MALVAFVILLCLGAWQLQRMTWKTHLLARIAALQGAPAEPLNVVLNRVRDGGEVNFVRVVANCAALGGRAANLYGLREAQGPGWRQVFACRLPQGAAFGSILVDAGYEPGSGMAAPSPQPLALAGDARLTGVLRAPEPPPWFAGLIGEGKAGAARSAASGQWFQRDIPAMARTLGAPSPAPVMLLLESPRAAPGLTPAALPSDILPASRHLEYALTWFGLAGTLAAFYAVVWVRGGAARKKRARR